MHKVLKIINAICALLLLTESTPSQAGLGFSERAPREESAAGALTLARSVVGLSGLGSGLGADAASFPVSELVLDSVSDDPFSFLDFVEESGSVTGALALTSKVKFSKASLKLAKCRH